MKAIEQYFHVVLIILWMKSQYVSIQMEPGRFDTKSFRYKVVSIQVVSIQLEVDSLHISKVDSIQTDVTWSCFDTEYYTTYKWLNEPSKTYSLELERTQMKQTHTSAWIKRQPAPQWEHANETRFWLSLFIEKRDLYKYIWDYFYNSSAYYAYHQETKIRSGSIMSCKSMMQLTCEETVVFLARG